MTAKNYCSLSSLHTCDCDTICSFKLTQCWRRVCNN